MTELVVQLPDDLVQRAKSAGLISDQAIQELLEDAMRRQAGRRLLEMVKRIHALNLPPMSDEEIMEEVRAVRAERRAAREKAGDAGRS